MYTIGNFEHLANYKAKVTDTFDYGETAIGQRLDVHFGGPIKGPRLSGTMTGIDYVEPRFDGTLGIHVRAMITTDDNALISVHINGFFNPETGAINDNRVQMLSSDERYRWLGDKIIIGRGKAGATSGAEGIEIGEIEVDYYYEL